MNNAGASSGAVRPGPVDEARKAQRREHLLEVATDEFARNGIASTNLDEIARRCSVSKTTIYRQFGNKEGLFYAALDRIADELSSEIAETLERRRSHDEVIEVFVRLSQRQSSQPRFGLLQWAISEASSYAELAPHMMAVIRATVAPVVEYILANADGALSREQAEWRGLMLVNMATGGMLRLIGWDAPNDPRWADEVIAIFLGRPAGA